MPWIAKDLARIRAEIRRCERSIAEHPKKHPGCPWSAADCPDLGVGSLGRGPDEYLKQLRRYEAIYAARVAADEYFTARAGEAEPAAAAIEKARQNALKLIAGALDMLSSDWPPDYGPAHHHAEYQRGVRDRLLQVKKALDEAGQR